MMSNWDFHCTACQHRQQTERVFKQCPSCGVGGFNMYHSGPVIEGSSVPMSNLNGINAAELVRIAREMNEMGVDDPRLLASWKSIEHMPPTVWIRALMAALRGAL